MSDIAIRVNGLGKQYKIGSKQERYRTLRDSIMNTALTPFRRVKGVLQGEPYSASGLRETIWALKYVSFEIKHGEVVGIIGRNGAGKSTLLKILSEITEPTEGTVDLYGRVGSLLEVGTGFHPELTGRENIYLNGAILGMTRVEIDKKFDVIVDFAEIDKFIDTPVKHYSSGMGLRLGFAVAAHLEPEILVVDEVLAVGDAAFQKKCIGKMGDVASEGRTVLFVSHNMPSIQRLCTKCIWIDNGKIHMIGPVDTVVHAYLDSSASLTSSAILKQESSKPMCLENVRVKNQYMQLDGIVELSECIEIELEYSINTIVSSTHVACFIYNFDGVCVLGSGDADLNPERLEDRLPGRYRSTFKIPPKLLGEDSYTITVTMGKPYVKVYDRHEAIVQFQVVDETSMRRQFQHKRRPGVLGIELPWTTERLE